MPDETDDADLARRRLEQFRRRLWSQSEMTSWYNLDFNDDGTNRLILQARLFAGTHDRPGELGANPYDHWHWEIFLQRRDLLPITQAAAELAMSVQQLRDVIGKFPEVELDRSFPDPWEHHSNSVIRKNFLRDFHNTFPNLRRVIFANYPAFITRLHAEIGAVLGIQIVTTRDKTDLALSEERVCPGYSIDFITGDPIGLGRAVYIDTGKPFELEFDSCSLLTFAHYQDDLRELVIGNPTGVADPVLMEQLNQAPLRP